MIWFLMVVGSSIIIWRMTSRAADRRGHCFIALILQTKSVWIACCGLFEIVISFPIGLFVWVVIMRQDYVTYLMYNGVFHHSGDRVR